VPYWRPPGPDAVDSHLATLTVAGPLIEGFGAVGWAWTEDEIGACDMVGWLSDLVECEDGPDCDLEILSLNL
jgi:hypothetical protein